MRRYVSVEIGPEGLYRWERGLDMLVAAIRDHMRGLGIVVWPDLMHAERTFSGGGLFVFAWPEGHAVP